MSLPSGAQPDVIFLAGPMYWGSLFGYGLYGILVVQMLIYFHRFPNDPSQTKIIIWVLLFLETLITIFSTIAGNNILVSGWGSQAALAQLDWALGGTPLLTGLVATSAHSFYCWRIHRLRQLVIIPIVLVTVSEIFSFTKLLPMLASKKISLLTSSLAAYCGIRGHQIGIFRIRELRPYALVWIFGATFVDTSITICMVTILLQARSRTSFSRTTSIIQKLIALTIETAMPTGIAGLSHAILYVVFPNNNLHFMTFLMSAKFYSNSLLATLNARALIGQQNVIQTVPFWEDEPGRQTPTSAPRFFKKLSFWVPGSRKNPSPDPHAEIQVETITLPVRIRIPFHL
ncbi:hypothetical protein BDZ94DRAFT_1314387 [Collybia nuda]|uniref:DUF6534 domain-containing protein n=1 Tax=Collybia nuda TaxID=64659 RepID=A0A9P5XVB3_9AGAR|nr:hypothetical protein BDZ94DRAFT_1314387 [Collybia nuda]